MTENINLEQLDEESHKLVCRLSQTIHEYLFSKVQDTKYSPVNLVLNVLAICVFRATYPSITADQENNFLVGFAKTIKANYTANRLYEKELNENRTDAP